jgi:hypothetical protein
MDTRDEKQDKLNEAVLLCTMHIEKMSFAYKKLEKYFPLIPERYNALEPEEISFIDQLIFRFSKLQDSMGGKLFPSLLENLGEKVRGIPFIDLLNKLEELAIIKDISDWQLLRETRNIVTHEYPFNTEDVIEGLNLLGKHYKLILNVWQQVNDYINRRFGILKSGSDT